MENQDNKIVLFQEKSVRREWHKGQWHFSIVDVIEVLTDSPIPRNYWTKIKKSLVEESQLHPFWMQLKLTASDGKELTEEWQNRGVKQGQEYSILTAEIAKATFGLTPSKHKKLKNLDKQKLLKKRMMKFNLLAIG